MICTSKLRYNLYTDNKELCIQLDKLLVDINYLIKALNVIGELSLLSFIGLY